ncbi:MAG: PIN domain-containing protein, partial [Salinisphaeraceae bacterium]
RVELRRAVAAAGGLPEDERQVEAILGDLDLLVVDDGVLHDAGALPDAGLRSLDAIHVASAALLGDDLSALVTYDRRMLDAAQRAGLPTAAPSL